MESVEAVEKILNYSFTNKNLLKEAITFTASDCIESSPIFERLEFLGDSVLEVAITNYIHLTYPNIEIKELRKLQRANVSNETFARVAVRNNLYQYIIRENPDTQAKKIKKFSEAVREEDEPVPHGGRVKAPKVLADLVEAIAGAVYIDVNFDLQRLWEIFRGLLEPIYTLDDLRLKPRESPFLLLFCLCQIHRKRIDFRYSKDDSEKHIAEVYLDDKFIASGYAISRDFAKLFAAKKALKKLSKWMPIEKIIDEDNLDNETEDKKEKLFEFCSTEKLQLQTISSSLPTASENPLMATAEDSPYVEPEDVKGKSFEICSNEKLQLQTISSSLATASENHLTNEMTQEQMVIDEESPHVELEDAKGKLVEIFSTRKLQIETGSSSLSTASPNPLTYEMTTKQMVVDGNSLEAGPENAKSKLIIICNKNKWPNPIFSVEEERGPEKKQIYVCSVKIEIPCVEGTFHMKGDAKLRKKEAEFSAAYHMIRALDSSLMSLVISNLQMQKSLDEKKRKQNSLDEKKNLHSKKRKRKSLVENLNLQMLEKIDEKKNLQTQESLDEKKNLQMQEILDDNKNLHSKKRKRKNLDEKMNLQMQEKLVEKKNLQTQESSDENKNLQMQEGLDEKNNLQTLEDLDKKNNLQTHESSDEKKNLQTQESSDENKNLQMQEGLDEKNNLQMPEDLDEKNNLQTQESSDEKKNLQTQESSDEMKNLQTQEGSDEKKNLQTQEGSDENKNLQMQEGLNEKNNLQTPEDLDEKKNLQTQESSDEKKNLQTQESSDENKNLQMKEGLDEKNNLQMPEDLDEKNNLQTQESSDEKKNLKTQESSDEKKNLQTHEGSDEKKNLQMQESSDKKKNLQMQEGLDEKSQMQESSDEKKTSQMQESSDEKNLHPKKPRRRR